MFQNWFSYHYVYGIELGFFVICEKLHEDNKNGHLTIDVLMYCN